MNGAAWRIGPGGRPNRRIRVAVVLGSVVLAGALSVLTSLDRRSGHPIRIARWDPRTRTVRESTCIPDSETRGAEAYQGKDAAPDPHSCSRAS